MTFSQYCGISLVPLLSRLVLAAAFIAAGYNKIFNTADYTAAEADKLKAWGVDVTGPQKGIVDARGWGAAELVIVPASFQQTQPSTAPAQTPEKAPEPTPEKAPDDIVKDALEAVDQATHTMTIGGGAQPEQDAVIDVNPPSGTTVVPVMPEPRPFKAAALHGVSLLVDKHGLPQPQWQGYLAAGTELMGGALLLVGLFSRIWGLGLAIAMGMAMYLTGYAADYWNLLINHGPFAIGESQHMQLFSSFFLQAALCVLAFGVFLTGPGPLSIDRMLFGPPVKPQPAPITPPPPKPKFD